MSAAPERKRILLIDDEDDIREVAQASLELVGGYEVLAARTGIEGLAIAEDERPDAILLDVMMPDMDGPTTLTWLRAQPATRDIPVVFLTAKVQGSDLRRFAGLGVAGTLAKPFDPLTLAARLEEALGWSAPR